MNKKLIRVVALLLIPCLVAEPSLAAVRGLLSVQQSASDSHPERFNEEALTLAVVAFPHPIHDLSAIRMAFSHMAHLAAGNHWDIALFLVTTLGMVATAFSGFGGGILNPFIGTTRKNEGLLNSRKLSFSSMN